MRYTTSISYQNTANTINEQLCALAIQLPKQSPKNGRRPRKVPPYQIFPAYVGGSLPVLDTRPRST